MWKSVYFPHKLSDSDRENLSGSEARAFSICDRVFRERFTAIDQQIVEMYYNRKWGDDQYVVEEYAKTHNIPLAIIWITIRRARREIMEQMGILDKRKGDKKYER